MQNDIEKKVPKAVFIVPHEIFQENIEEVSKREGTDNLLAAFNQQYNKYKLLEGQLVQSNQNMVSKIPQIEKTIQMIHALTLRKQTKVDFMLSEGIFVKAKSKPGLERIALWLGANTIVELTFTQATKLLNENLENARISLKRINDELSYVRDQRTVTEVNIARIYNFSLLEKRDKQLKKQSVE